MSDFRRDLLPLASLYICCAPCAPCACLVSSAFAMCEEFSLRARTFFSFAVRPDDRLMSSCCTVGERSIGLLSIIQKLKDLDLSRSGIGLRKHLDRTWIEQRLYQLEEMHQLDASTNVSALARQVFQSHESEDTCAAIIILGELGYCLPIMHTPLFPSLPRIPRETEIYRMKKEISGPLWSRKYLGAFTAKPLPAGIVSRTGNPPANPRIISTNTPMLYRRTRTVHERSPPPSAGIKRRKNSTGSSVEMEIAPHAPPDVALNWLDTNENSSIMSI